jgi:hypothetical protein
MLAIAGIVTWSWYSQSDPVTSLTTDDGPRMGDLTGYVGRIDRSTQTVDVSESMLGLRPVSLVVTNDSSILVRGKQGGLGDLWKDMPVRVYYEVRNDVRYATSIQVLSDESPSAKPTSPVASRPAPAVRPEVVAPKPPAEVVAPKPPAEAPKPPAEVVAPKSPAEMVAPKPPAEVKPAVEPKPVVEPRPAPEPKIVAEPKPVIERKPAAQARATPEPRRRPEPRPAPEVKPAPAPVPAAEAPSAPVASAAPRPAPAPSPAPTVAAPPVAPPAVVTPTDRPPDADAGDGSAVIDWLLRDGRRR